MVLPFRVAVTISIFRKPACRGSSRKVTDSFASGASGGSVGRSGARGAFAQSEDLGKHIEDLDTKGIRAKDAFAASGHTIPVPREPEIRHHYYWCSRKSAANP